MSKNSETALINFIRKRFPIRRNELVKGIGDDAAVFRNGFVVSTDSFFESIHFDLSYFSFNALGRHCLAASLSDLAAMGALPVCALISLNLTKQIGIKQIDELYKGFSRVTRRYKCDIAGGDIVASPSFGMSITVIGRARKVMLRSGAKPGQMLFVTNFLGLAETGRAVLQHGYAKQDFSESIKKHLYPEPRIREAQRIRRYARSCIDVSDGLSTDATHLAEESGVKIVIDAEHVPIHSEVGEYCDKENIEPLEFILSSGEDFELLFTASQMPRIQGVKIFKIGRVMRGKGLFVSLRGKEKRIEPSGYEHLT